MAFLRLIRVKNLIIIGLLQYLLRYGLMLPILYYYELEPVLSDIRFALMVLATIVLAASGYVINDYFDVKIDRVNRPDKVIVDRVIPRRTVLLWHVILTFTGIFIGLSIAYFTRKEMYALVFVLIPGILWFYSTTLKKQILLGNVAIAFLTALVPYIVVSLEFASLIRVYGESVVDTKACSVAWFWTTGFAFFAFLSTLSREIIKDMEDVEGDSKAGCNTLPVAMGIDNTRKIVVLLTVFSIVALWTAWYFVPQLRGSIVSIIYFVLLLTLPYLYLIKLIFKADKKRDFYIASQVSKFIMLFGILFIIVAGSFFS
ncbi:geranylgeranylglycerol-phosphate geranylgeranyltransferase [Marinilabiliaceae bacterium ANBcel2]|nr:geranylgeranylglycerol-phosphate geranylgeranyltransferase [Marinilabiliaceae bacterium ANBcel2]